MKLLELCGKDESSIEYVKDRAGHDARYSIDYTKAKNELGWEPQVNLEDGLRMTKEWYDANQDWIDEIKSGDYEKYYNKQYKER